MHTLYSILANYLCYVISTLNCNHHHQTPTWWWWRCRRRRRWRWVWRRRRCMPCIGPQKTPFKRWSTKVGYGVIYTQRDIILLLEQYNVPKIATFVYATSWCRLANTTKPHCEQTSYSVSKEVTKLGVILVNNLTFDSYVYRHAVCAKIVFHPRALKPTTYELLSTHQYLVALLNKPGMPYL